MIDNDPTTTPEEVASLRATTLRGAAHTLIGYTLSRGIMFGVLLVLARLVTPRDFGHFAAANVVNGVGSLFSEGGMASALMRRRDRVHEAASTAFFALLAGGTLLTLAALAIAPALGAFFRSASVTALAAALSVALLLQSLMVVPDTLLQRQFSFLRRVAIDPLAAFAYAGTSVLLASQGAGAWSLVGGTYAAMTVAVVASWGFVRFRPRLREASVAMWRELAAFARWVVASEILTRAAVQLDAVLVGRFQGAASLGQYRNGLRLAQQPSEAFLNVGGYVLLPALVRIADQPDRLRAAARRIFSLIIALALPASLMFVALGKPAAVLLLGARWAPAGRVIAGLCGLLIAQAAMAAITEVIKAVGKPALLVRMQFVSLISVVVFVGAAVVPFGLLGVAIAVSASRCLTAAYGMYSIRFWTGLDARGLFHLALGPAVAAAWMLAAMLAFAAEVHPLAHPEAGALALALIETVVGALVYGAFLAALDPGYGRPLLARLVRLARWVGARPRRTSS